MDDDSCAVNETFAGLMRANVQHFADTGAAPARAFEYYLDGILFKSLVPVLGHVIQADLRVYRDAGVHTVQALMTGDRPWLSPPLNLWLFPRLAWALDQDPRVLRHRFLETWFGGDASLARDIYIALEGAMTMVLSFEPGEAEPPALSGDLLIDPPADMLDPIYAPRPLMMRRADAFAKALPILDEIAPRLSRADTQRMIALRAEFELARYSVRYMAARHRAYLNKSQADVAEARVALRAIRRWARRHINDPIARANFNLLRLSWHLHIEALYYQRANRLVRSLLLVYAYLRLIWPVFRLRFAQRGKWLQESVAGMT
jgi:hypothetical protein